jgi:hypothetical protein
MRRTVISLCALMLAAWVGAYSLTPEISIEFGPNPSVIGYTDVIITNHSLLPLQRIEVGCFEDGVELRGPIFGDSRGEGSILVVPTSEVARRIHRYRSVGYGKKIRFTYVPLTQAIVDTTGTRLRIEYVDDPHEYKMGKGEGFLSPLAIHSVLFMRYRPILLQPLHGALWERRFSFVARRHADGGFTWNQRDMSKRPAQALRVRSTRQPLEFALFSSNAADVRRPLNVFVKNKRE